MSRRVYVRKFDWDEARRLRAEGLTYTAIAARFGVSDTAVKRVCNPDYYERNARNRDAYQRSGRCPDCGAQTTRRSQGDCRCAPCAHVLLASSVRATELKCFRCGQWKPDGDFPGNRANAGPRRGRHGMCRACNTIERREHRHRNPEASRAYDREYRRRRAQMKKEEAAL